jgi:predicted ATP-grasp superfamily ATP-dependent carboligase
VGVFDVSAAFVRKQRLHLEAHSIRQHTSAYVSIRQHTSAHVSIRQHTSAFDVSAAFVRKQRLHLEAYGLVLTWFSLASAAPSSGSSGFS